MATRYGRTFRTRKGRYGRYKYVNGRRVSFVAERVNYRAKNSRRYRRY